MKQLGPRATENSSLSTTEEDAAYKASPSSVSSQSWQGPRVPLTSHPNYAPTSPQELKQELWDFSLLSVHGTTDTQVSNFTIPSTMCLSDPHLACILLLFLCILPLFSASRASTQIQDLCTLTLGYCNGLLIGFSVPSVPLLQSTLNTVPSEWSCQSFVSKTLNGSLLSNKSLNFWLSVSSPREKPFNSDIPGSSAGDEELGKAWNTS